MGSALRSLSRLIFTGAQMQAQTALVSLLRMVATSPVPRPGLWQLQ